MTCKTIVNTQKYTLATTSPATEILPPNPRRKAFVLSPIAGGISATPTLVAVAFAAGAGQTWQVPAGVTSIVDIFAWGAGGDSGAAGALLGGGGGGGGGFSTLGPLAAIPGTIYQIRVDTHGVASTSSVKNPAGTTIVLANSGTNGVLEVAGRGGVAGTGAIRLAGGDAATAAALVGAGAGGGGGSGYNAIGSNGAAQVGGAGGGAAVYSTYGAGGAGGAGGNANVDGTAGTSPGGGGGGGGATTGAVGAGANGLVVVFYLQPDNLSAISVSPRPDVAVGQGVLQWLPGMTYPYMMTDEDVGNGITEPWYAISGIAGIVLQITEYSYEPGTERPAY